METDPKKDELIDSVLRNGTLTVVGIVLSFSLGFLTHWAANPIPWQPKDGLGLFPILLGIVCQIKALSLLLDDRSLQRASFRRANQIFLAGVILCSGGVMMAILLDFFEMAGVPQPVAG